MIDTVQLLVRNRFWKHWEEYSVGVNGVDYIQINPDLDGIRVVMTDGSSRGVYGALAIRTMESLPKMEEPKVEEPVAEELTVEEEVVQEETPTPPAPVDPAAEAAANAPEGEQ